VAQAVPSKCEALSSDPSTAKKKDIKHPNRTLQVKVTYVYFYMHTASEYSPRIIKMLQILR
jgi:hypothetical protein